MDKDILTQFCGNYDGRFCLTKPFVQRGHLYATDGRAVVRIPSTDEDTKPPDRQTFPDGAQMFDANWIEPKDELPPLTDLTQEVDGPCYCQRECPCCDGTGTCVCDDCEDEHDCRKCNSRGVTGQVGCPECNGRGEIKVQIPAPQLISGLWIHGKYASILHSLPGSVVVGRTKCTILSFRCGELEGLVAHLKLREEDVARYTPAKAGRR